MLSEIKIFYSILFFSIRSIKVICKCNILRHKFVIDILRTTMPEVSIFLVCWRTSWISFTVGPTLFSYDTGIIDLLIFKTWQLPLADLVSRAVFCSRQAWCLFEIKAWNSRYEELCIISHSVYMKCFLKYIRSKTLARSFLVHAKWPRSSNICLGFNTTHVWSISYTISLTSRAIVYDRMSVSPAYHCMPQSVLLAAKLLPFRSAIYTFILNIRLDYHV